MKVSEISKAIETEYLIRGTDNTIAHLMIDSRKAFDLESGLFFAIDGPHHDGHNFIPDLIAAGFQNFVVEKDTAIVANGINVLKVASSIKALQAIAKIKREIR